MVSVFTRQTQNNALPAKTDPMLQHCPPAGTRHQTLIEAVGELSHAATSSAEHMLHVNGTSDRGSWALPSSESQKSNVHVEVRKVGAARLHQEKKLR